MKWVISMSCHYVTSLEYNVLNTANTYDWMIATADSRINRRICAVIKIPCSVHSAMFRFTTVRFTDRFLNNQTNNSGAVE
jgi:hypothetical protein